MLTPCVAAVTTATCVKAEKQNCDHLQFGLTKIQHGAALLIVGGNQIVGSLPLEIRAVEVLFHSSMMRFDLGNRRVLVPEC